MVEGVGVVQERAEVGATEGGAGGLDLFALSRWLGEHVSDLAEPLTASRIGAGQSNITYRLTDAAGREWVLRKPPSGLRAATAHDVLREARVLRQLAGAGIPLPTVVATADDQGPLDDVFYVMTRMPGVVLESPTDAGVLRPDQRVSLGLDVVAVLARLHQVEPDGVGLGDLGPREDYLARQMRRADQNWARWSEASAAAPAWVEVRRRLARDVPVQQRVAIVHGDYRLSNLLVDDGRVSAVLDWELCALGDPLADLAWLLDDWRSPDEPMIAFPSPTQAGGFIDRAALVERYAELTGLDPASIDYYRAFSHWRAATLIQGVLVRRRAGGLGSHGAIQTASLAHTVAFLLDEALEFV